MTPERPGVDVSGLVAEARDNVAALAEAYIRHTAPHFVGLVAHGSAVKGGVIAGCSDIDLQLYLADEAFSWYGTLPLRTAVAIRADTADVSPHPFRYVQCYPLRPRLPENWVGPIPGAYHVIAGRCPVPEASPAELAASAATALADLSTKPERLVNALLGRGAGRTGRHIRLLCTQVWPAIYQVLALEHGDPLGTWTLTKQEAVERLPEASGLRGEGGRFLAALHAYYPAEDDLAAGAELVGAGLAFLEGARRWGRTRGAR